MKNYVIFICLSVFAFSLWTVNSLFADITTLKRIAKAGRDTNYVGVRLKTSSTSHRTRTMEELVVHRAADYSYSKVLSVAGEKPPTEERTRERHQREGNRDNHRRNRGSRDAKRWNRNRNQLSEKEIELIAQNYHLEKRTSDEKIANYDTDLLIIKPKFDGRPTKYIFFARENGVILMVKDVDAEDTLREMFVYIRISFDPEIVKRKWEKFEKEIRPEPRHSHSISLADAEKVLKTAPIQPEYLPLGFQLLEIRRIENRKNTIHLTYTDGLLGLSIFETTRQRRSNQKRDWRQIEIGGTPVYTHQRGQAYAFGWSQADTHFLLFGAVPTTEMQKVVESMIHKTNQK